MVSTESSWPDRTGGGEPGPVRRHRLGAGRRSAAADSDSRFAARADAEFTADGRAPFRTRNRIRFSEDVASMDESLTLEQLDQALDHHRAGRFAEAQNIYLQV